MSTICLSWRDYFCSSQHLMASRLERGALEAALKSVLLCIISGHDKLQLQVAFYCEAFRYVAFRLFVCPLKAILERPLFLIYARFNLFGQYFCYKNMRTFCLVFASHFERKALANMHYAMDCYGQFSGKAEPPVPGSPRHISRQPSDRIKPLLLNLVPMQSCNAYTCF